ncbi:MAG: transcription termination/antitermination protein NusG [Candidatus Andersenbacteria bacterium]
MAQESQEQPTQQVAADGRSWYVLHTYSGYEDNVARNLRQRIESMGMEDKIFDVVVPREKKIRVKNGKRRTIEERLFPGYVLVQMIVTEDSWYVVRNTPNVTGFVGSGTTPTPVSEDEIKRLLSRMGEDEPKYKMDVEEGDSVKIMDGPFKDFEGKIAEVSEAKGTVKVLVNVFGRETPVELDFLQVKREG